MEQKVCDIGQQFLGFNSERRRLRKAMGESVARWNSAAE
jgi:hypothetical protein